MLTLFPSRILLAVDTGPCEDKRLLHRNPERSNESIYQLLRFLLLGPFAYLSWPPHTQTVYVSATVATASPLAAKTDATTASTLPHAIIGAVAIIHITPRLTTLPHEFGKRIAKGVKNDMDDNSRLITEQVPAKIAERCLRSWYAGYCSHRQHHLYRRM